MDLLVMSLSWVGVVDFHAIILLGLLLAFFLFLVFFIFPTAFSLKVFTASLRLLVILGALSLDAFDAAHLLVLFDRAGSFALGDDQLFFHFDFVLGTVGFFVVGGSISLGLLGWVLRRCGGIGIPRVALASCVQAVAVAQQNKKAKQNPHTI
jgi:hypothetical protein